MPPLLFLLLLIPIATAEKVLCEFYDSNESPSNYTNFFQSSGGMATDGATDRKVMVCGKESKFCYSLWLLNGEEKRFLMQGCWEASPPNNHPPKEKTSGYCMSPTCTAYYNNETKNQMHFCCCQGDLCNRDVDMEFLKQEIEEEIILEENNSLIYFFVGFLGFLLVSVVMVILKKVGFKKKKTLDEENLLEKLEDKFGLDFGDIIVGDGFASGRYGTIHNATLKTQPIALKIYGHHHRDFYANEKFIYEIINGSENILRYHGYCENEIGLMLAFDLLECNLRDYLKIQGIVGFEELINVSMGIVRGVAVLHGGGGGWGGVVHRDLTTRNILIKNSTPQICDFGLSLATRGNNYFYCGKERQAEFNSLQEAGTLRYMSPELLEGAVNLKDCENSLKQADVYSLALILWEVGNSVGVVRVGGEAAWELPFSEEGGKETLTLDDIVRLVVQQRVRPGFHNWVDTLLTKTFMETLCDSWDAEPDARLTPLCILERLLEIKSHLPQNKFTALKSVNPLETKRVIATEEPAWINRNPCMERNLLMESGSVTDNSVVTMGTNLSCSEGSGKFINVARQPKPISFVQNIQRRV